ncbi:RICIN domain-containing protein [Streptomyces sp. NBC_00199]|uniref:RICIN domain-containing protein n=1 Tax=Streptomyces sp. NBC_00199 TaxID=2975678 RepID=UPI002253AAE1|nr:RICIN domain-containing protein [Streptomyces sp. NBC_00199]MCX5264691.1 RICIN domain-containing protein [Streptomyces sp. NBC_00199]
MTARRAVHSTPLSNSAFQAFHLLNGSDMPHSANTRSRPRLTARGQAGIATAAATLSVLGAFAAPAQAADAVEHYGNAATGSCLDDSAAGLRGFSCNGSNYQNWRVHVWNDGTRQFRNVATGRCLYDDGVTLATRSCNSSTQQSWWVWQRGGGAISLENQATSECLDDSEFGLRTIGCDPGNRHQNWR